MKSEGGGDKLPSGLMLVRCDQCQAKYKITIKSAPGKPVTFRCGKCKTLIKISPEEIAAQAGPARPVAAPPPVKAAAGAETVKVNCLKCGTPFIKPVEEKSPICYQCRIDSLVNKIKDKYGVTAAPAAAEDVHRYTIRSADGLVLGPIRLRSVKVLAREKRIKGTEDVSKDGSDYRPLLSYPELAELFPELKEIMDTSGLEDKVEEAFMAAFGKEEEPEPGPPAALPEPPLPPPSAEVSEEPSEPAAPQIPAESEPSPPPPEPASPPESESPAAEEPEPAVPPPSKAAAPAPEPAEAAGEPAPPVVKVEESFSLEEPTPSPAEPPAPPPEAPAPRPPAKVSEEPSEPAAPETLAEAEPSPPPPELAAERPCRRKAAVEDEEVGKEWNGSEEEEEIIEDLEPLPEPPPDARYRIRYPDGLMLGPVKLATIKELFQSGNLTGQEEVQRENEPWAAFAELPELADLVGEADVISDDEILELTDVLEEKT